MNKEIQELKKFAGEILSEGLKKNNKNSWIKRSEKVNFISKNPTIEFERDSAFIEKIADGITAVSGSMTFVYIHIVWFAVWVLINLNMTMLKPFDQFPFGLL